MGDREVLDREVLDGEMCGVGGDVMSANSKQAGSRD